MLKLIGILLLIISSSMIGFKAGDNLQIQNEQLKHLKKLIILLRGEINYNCSAISEALINISNRTNKEYSDFLVNTSKDLDKYEGKSLKEIWNRNVELYLGKTMLSKHHLNGVRELSESLGFLDKEMQLSSIDLFLEKLGQDIEDNDKKLKDNQKLYKYLGVMCGILITLIIT